MTKTLQTASKNILIGANSKARGRKISKAYKNTTNKRRQKHV